MTLDYSRLQTEQKGMNHESKNMINWTSPKLKTSISKRLMKIKRIATYWVKMLENHISDPPHQKMNTEYIKNSKEKKQ